MFSFNKFHKFGITVSKYIVKFNLGKTINRKIVVTEIERGVTK